MPTRRSVARRILRRKRALVGTGLLAYVVWMAIYGLFLDPYPARAFPCLAVCSSLPPFTDIAHVFGTNSLGQDLFSEVAHGAAVDLYIGFGATLIAVTVGVVAGSASGYWGGARGRVTLGAIQLVFLMPTFVVIVWFYRSFGSSDLFAAPFQITYLMLLLGVFAWPPVAMVARNEVIRVKQEEFITGARVIGAGGRRVFFRHILPNMVTPVIGLLGVVFAANITAEALFAYLGLVDPTTNVVTWGFLIWEGQKALASQWWLSFFPGLMLVFTTVGVTLLGDVVSEETNPKLRSAGNPMG